jgi:hypothetical protein
MSGFDIETLHDFTPPKLHCERCLAIFTDAKPFGWPPSRTKLVCPVCGVEYLPTETYSAWRLDEYLPSVAGLSTRTADDPIKHARALAGISMRLRTREEKFPPIRALLLAVSSAASFVHFVSFGISVVLIGALKIVAQRVPVRGVISAPDRWATEELVTKYEAPLLNLKVLDRAQGDVPHQKVVVVDGLLAFKGSANLTVQGWRKAAQGLDIVETVTRLDEVISLHNTYFAPLWGRLSDVKSPITMDVPF